MTGLQNTHWSQFDLQVERRNQQLAYIALNNLYLGIEAGRVELTITSANNLRVLAGLAYDQGDPMLDWWMGEFQTLPNWLNV